jgi:Flp pilus assembly protein TadB
MAIDGRRIARPPDDEDPAQATGVRVVAFLIVAIPVLALVALAYVIGTMTGGVPGGLLSVVSTALTIAVLWWFRRRRRR